MKTVNSDVILEKDEAGWYIADVPALQGCHTQGKTKKEVMKNVKEAIELCLEVEEKKSNKGDYDKLNQGDDITINNVADLLIKNKNLIIENKNILLEYDLSERDREIIIAGGKLNFIMEMAKNET